MPFPGKIGKKNHSFHLGSFKRFWLGFIIIRKTYQPVLALLARALDKKWFGGYVFAGMSRANIIQIYLGLGTTVDKTEAS